MYIFSLIRTSGCKLNKKKVSFLLFRLLLFPLCFKEGTKVASLSLWKPKWRCKWENSTQILGYAICWNACLCESRQAVYWLDFLTNRAALEAQPKASDTCVCMYACAWTCACTCMYCVCESTCWWGRKWYSTSACVSAPCQVLYFIYSSRQTEEAGIIIITYEETEVKRGEIVRPGSSTK